MVMTKFLMVLGGLAALGLAVISTTANFRFGTLLTSGDERWIYGAVFGLLDVLKIVLLPLAGVAFAAGLLAKGRSAVVLFVLLSALSFTASIGLYATTKSEAIGDAKAAQERYAAAKAAKERADADLAAMGPMRALGEIEGQIGALKRDPLFDRSKQCSDATAPESRALCASLDRLAGERDKALERRRLEAAAADAALALEKQDVAAAMRSIDPQAEALARVLAPVFSVDADTVRTGLAVLIALLIELGSGLGPWLVAPTPGRRSAPSAGTNATPVAPAPVITTDALPALEPQILDADAMEPVTLGGADETGAVAAWASAALQRRRGAFIPAKEVRAAYEAHCEALGTEPLNPNAFGRAMTQAGFSRSKVGGSVRYDGVAFTTAAPVRLAVSNDRIGRPALGTMTTIGVRA
jgi:hypothetical protein